MSLAPFRLERTLQTVFAQPESSGPQSPRAARDPLVKSLAASAASARVYAAEKDGPIAVYSTQDATLRLESHLESTISPSKRPIDRLAVLDAVGKMIVLGAGTLTFHSLSGLGVVDAGAAGSVMSNGVKNVVLFAVDETMSGKSGGVNVAIVRRVKRTDGVTSQVGLYKVTRTGVDSVKADMPLPADYNTGSIGVLRGQYLCLGNAHEYMIVDFKLLECTEPIMQVSNDPPADDGSINRNHPPIIAAIGRSEFLLASHTGTSSLGIFVRAQSGDPCRGTVQWHSSVRSLAIDAGPEIEDGFVLALLRTNVFEIHRLADTAHVAQTIDLGSQLDGRSLISVHSFPGIDVPTEASSAGALTLISIPLLPAETTIELAGPDGARRVAPSTPTRARPRPRKTASITAVRTFLLCRNSLHALVSSTLLDHAEHMLARGKPEEAIGLVRASPDASPDLLRYVDLKAGLLYVLDTRFDEAIDCFVRGSVDPRLIVRMWRDLRGSLIDHTPEDAVATFAGLHDLIRDCDKGINGIIQADIHRNYSSPSVDVDRDVTMARLRSVLEEKSRAMALQVLQDWRTRRTEQGTRGSRATARIVDTTLAKLLIEAGDEDAMLALTAIEDSDVVLDELAPWLLDRNLEKALAKVFLSRGRTEQVVELWIRLYDEAESEDSRPVTLREIGDLVRELESRDLRRRYSLWLLRQDRAIGLDALSTISVDSSDELRQLYASLAEIDSTAADEFIERAVLLGQTDEAEMHTALAERLIDGLSRQAPSRTDIEISRTQGFADALVAQSSSTMVTSRLKLIVLLHTSTAYDVSRVRVAIERRPELAFERAIIYGRALSTLIVTLGDFASAELYCTSRGDVVSARTVQAIGSVLGVPIAASIEPEQRTRSSSRDLTKLLIDICLDHRDALEQDHMSNLVNAQAVHLDTLHTLSALPDSWTLASVAPFLERSCRRSTHARQTAQIVKSLATHHTMTTGDRLFRLQQARGGVAARAGDLVDEKGAEVLLAKAVEKMSESDLL